MHINNTNLIVFHPNQQYNFENAARFSYSGVGNNANSKLIWRTKYCICRKRLAQPTIAPRASLIIKNISKVDIFCKRQANSLAPR
jgi:hypothetical protein